EHRQPLVELLASDVQRRADHDDVPVHEEVETAVERRLRQLRHGSGRFAAGVEGDERLARLAVANELEPPEEPEPAHVADRRMPVLYSRERVSEVVALR